MEMVGVMAKGSDSRSTVRSLVPGSESLSFHCPEFAAPVPDSQNSVVINAREAGGSAS